ncbi:MAG: hypothetical protein VYA81_02570 [SAR324 cluster bacterium]|nr:hypothetical protein [SAR324 cluster bacterium]
MKFFLQVEFVSDKSSYYRNCNRHVNGGGNTVVVWIVSPFNRSAGGASDLVA